MPKVPSHPGRTPPGEEIVTALQRRREGHPESALKTPKKRQEGGKVGAQKYTFVCGAPHPYSYILLGD
jgi:hypothetical protein